ncbi:putative small multi-drug export protein [Sinobaca qinghaiensis]|uniref:Putative small multi-drug export protein n=1 Tax=Sinobaca qinghaiensis TaxID=342944 RepID=A0A419UX63_9BACL|nr:small multi-drug export protein [Sinobaca qinghaiensis]RKD69732.1 putative small multi-drug export protein [Sinobaca qinghaiensis]
MGIIELLGMYLLIFILSAVPFFEAYGVIPIAVIAGIPAVPAFLIGWIGNVITVLLLLVFITRVQEWVAARRKKKHTDKEVGKRSQRAQRLWEKYGLPGLSIIGPLFVGSHLTAFMGMSLGGSKKKIFYWVSASIALWSIVFSILAYAGIGLLGQGEETYIERFFE